MQRSHHNHTDEWLSRQALPAGSVFAYYPPDAGQFSYAAIQVILGSHAATAHPDTYAATRNCLNKNGVWKVYQEPKPTDNTFHWLCQDPITKTVYDMIVEKINETTYREKTAFMPKDGTWNKVFRWLIEGEGKRGGTWQNPPTGTIELLPP